MRCKLDGCNRVAIGKMQLCRAHGGGSRARTKKSSQELEPTMFGNMDMGMQQGMSTMEFSTAASV